MKIYEFRDHFGSVLRTGTARVATHIAARFPSVIFAALVAAMGYHLIFNASAVNIATPIVLLALARLARCQQ